MEPSKFTPAGADWLTLPTTCFLNLGTTDGGNQLILCCGAVLGTVECPHPLDAIKPCPCPSVTTRNVSKHCPLSSGGQNHPLLRMTWAVLCVTKDHTQGQSISSPTPGILCQQLPQQHWPHSMLYTHFLVMAPRVCPPQASSPLLPKGNNVPRVSCICL